MQCNVCGAHNPDGSDFCGNCGRPLASSDTVPEKNAPVPSDDRLPSLATKPKLGKRQVVALSIASAILLLVATFFVAKQANIRRLERELVAAESADDERERLALNKKLYDLTGDTAYREEMLRLQDKEKWRRIANEASELISKGDYPAARQKILALSGEGDTTTAITAELQNQLNQALEKEAAALEASKPPAPPQQIEKIPVEIVIKESRQAAPPEPAPQKKSASSQSNLSIVANNLRDKRLTVTALNANVRSGPGLNYSLEYSIPKGDDVYVYDTLVNGKVIWLYIGDGWTSHKNFNGDLYY